MNMSRGSSTCFFTPSKSGKSFISSPFISTIFEQVFFISSLISKCNHSGKISPVFSSSNLDNNCLANLNDEGITPLPCPECTPTEETLTDRVPATIPLRL